MNYVDFLQFFGPVALVVGGYVGVKADLAVTRQIAVEAMEHAKLAHARIDSLTRGK